MADELTAKELIAEELTLKESTAEESTADQIAVDQTAENLTAEQPTAEVDCNSTVSAKVDLPIAPRRPLVLDEDPSYSGCIDRPLIISGQVVGMTALLVAFFWVLTSVFAAMTASAAIPTITYASTWKIFVDVVCGGLIFFYATEWLFGWLRLPKVAVFIVALYAPIFQIIRLVPLRGLASIDNLSIQGFAKYLRGSNHFAEAAGCYSQALSSLSPLSIERQKYERFYAFSLFYDGQTDRAIQYSEELLAYWQGVTDDVTRVNTVQRLGYAVYTRATLYYLAGDKESACRLQHAFYEKAKKIPSPNEAQTIAMLCEGQALLNEQKFENAKSLLSDCCESLKWHMPNDLKMAAHQAYALSLAHCDDKAFALNQLNVAAKHCASNDERLSNALARVEIFKTVKELDSAKKTIKEIFEQLHPAPDSFMFESLKRAADSIYSSQLLSSIQSDTKSALTKSAEHSGSDLPAEADLQRALPSRLFFQSYTGIGLSDFPHFLAGFVAIMIADFFKAAANAPWLYGFIVLLVCTRIYFMYWGRRKGAAAKAALDSASRLTYLAKTSGYGDVQLIDPITVKKLETTIYASPSLLREVKSICGEDLFTVTVFLKNGQPIALEVFGCYSSVSCSPYLL